jgi:hypothetical protein
MPNMSDEKTILYANSTTEDTRNWVAELNDSDILDCNNPSDQTTACAPGETASCVADYRVILSNQGNYSCDVLNPVQLQFHVSSTSYEDTTSEADCTSGSGRFFLLPLTGRDNDGDGRYHGNYFPIQVSGTGTMTRKAWITNITPYSWPSGVGLKAIKTFGNFFFTSADLLKNPSSTSVSISGNTSIDSGILPGQPMFAVEEVLEANIGTLQVDMTWSCTRTASTVSKPQGYQFRLSTIGCPANQKFTLRYATSPNRVYLEPYGLPDMNVVEPTTTTTEGKAFVIEHSGLMIDGTLVSTSSSQAVLDIDAITWQGENACTPGTYTLAVE